LALGEIDICWCFSKTFFRLFGESTGVGCCQFLLHGAVATLRPLPSLGNQGDTPWTSGREAAPLPAPSALRQISRRSRIVSTNVPSKKRWRLSLGLLGRGGGYDCAALCIPVLSGLGDAWCKPNVLAPRKSARPSTSSGWC